jgi:aspartyl-tRNA(Asn)/glutamyl-tRNA(Gln) amidotransferase subunit B
MNLIPVIGLEIHVQLKTKSKMFCSCANVFGDAQPNTSVCPICMGYPGTLPVPNKQAITWTHMAGAALNCELAQESKFDRKSYFYPDLPKGYQISQFDKPFCLKGSFSIMLNGVERTIGITRIHAEEDAAKNIHSSTGSEQVTLVDYNRAGTPLIEIVTEPDIATPEEAKVFLQELQRVMRTLNISDADMEKGQMRCDANISLRKDGETTLNPKTEVKNINSFKFVEKALAYEIERQTKLWEAGEIPHHATRGWNSEMGTTEEQRTKEDAADYRYFPEPDIPPFHFTQEELDAVVENLPELPSEARVRFTQEYGTSSDLAQLLIASPILADIFENVSSEISQMDSERSDIAHNEQDDLRKLAGNIILQDLRSIVEKDSLTFETLKITSENLTELVILLHQKKIGSNALRPVLDEMQRTGGDPDAIIDNLGLSQVSDADELEKTVMLVIEENQDVVEKIKAGKVAGLQFLMGHVMAKTGGRANPKVVIEMLKKIIGAA